MLAYQAKLAVPFAVLGIVADDSFLRGVDFLPIGTPELGPANEIAALACSQLNAYLSDPGYRFDLPLALGGTLFQGRVWQALREIPSGTTVTYGELARRLGTAPRPVGGACRANRIPLVIPCHRVVGQEGLGGFLGGTGGDPLEIKRWLLMHERG